MEKDGKEEDFRYKVSDSGGTTSDVGKIYKARFSCSYTKEVVAMVKLHARTLEEAINKARVSYILNSDLILESIEELPDTSIKI